MRTASHPWVSAILVGGIACSGGTTAPNSVATSLVSVSPIGGVTSVAPNTPIVIAFSHAMGSGMEMYVSLHEGDVTGPAVPGVMMWSSDRMTLTFTPTDSLKSATAYTLHVGGGMKDADGNLIDMTAHGMMGGQWASSSMMNGAGMMGGGGPMSGQEMGPGWMGSNGMYGMVFHFTTA
ncbi:MAG TPA: Ig-like domain-containing protein [Gemmatimonadales bacterium]|nr:Ig-like domain-containing protein [Gemmatimonadales bacterium]